MSRKASQANLPAALLCAASLIACNPSAQNGETIALDETANTQAIEAEIARLVWEFHAADTSKNAAAVIGLLWPDYSMRADGRLVSYADVSTGAPQFLASLETFHTVWTDLDVKVISPTLAVSSFMFSDSLVSQDGSVTLQTGPTSFVWLQRDGIWRIIYADADHYPVESSR